MSIQDILGLLTGKGKRVIASLLGVEGRIPEFTGITKWFNSPPLAKQDLEGKVALIDFWTYSCVNCIRTLPYLKAWHERYKDKGLVIVGIHTPEFDFERIPDNVEKAIAKFGLTYPVALDADYAMWNAYANHYWPAHYFVDAKGNIRYHHFGEGEYEHSEAVIMALLEEAGRIGSERPAPITTDGEKVDFSLIGTPETYLGFSRMAHLGSPESVMHGKPQRYSAVKEPAQNMFYFDGEWEVQADYAMPSEGARIVYKVTASKANLVMDGVGMGGTVDVRVDEKIAHRGIDVEHDGTVRVLGARLYNLMDTKADYGEHLLELTFRSASTKAYAFTFG